MSYTPHAAGIALLLAGSMTLRRRRIATTIATSRRGRHPPCASLISIDGFHQLDLDNYIVSHPHSTLAALAHTGVVYSEVSTSIPSDSFPGSMAIVTGGSPEEHPASSTTSPTTACSTRRLSVNPAPSGPGTVTMYNEFVDHDLHALDGGGYIDPSNLPRTATGPVYPHAFLEVNTMFEVIRASGRRTAWSDKSLAYEIVNGPSGAGVDDLYDPEINAGGTTGSITLTEAYDDIKVAAILHEIDGFDHTGSTMVGTPAIFGMNFQAVSVGQKLVIPADPIASHYNYLDAAGTPSITLESGLDHTDASLGLFYQRLKDRHLLDRTVIIVTAKHGNSPIDKSTLVRVDPALIPSIINGVAPGLAAQVTADDSALIWLTDQSRTADVVHALEGHFADAGIEKIWSGHELAERWGDPRRNSRTPDIIIQSRPGVLYSFSAKKNSDHGGFAADDTHVALVVSNPHLHPGTIHDSLTTAMVAPTVLRLFGLDTRLLDAVRQEGTTALPGLVFSDHDDD